MEAMGFGSAAVIWALASWVYFDATERGKHYPWIWALAVLFLGWTLIPEIIYLAVRNQGPHLEVADRVGVRQYLVTTSFTTMALSVFGAGIALSAALSWAVSSLSSNDFRDLLASSLAALIIGAALWLPHWHAMERQLKGALPDGEFRSLYGLRRTQLLTSIFLFGGVAVLAALWFLGGAISALFHASYAAAADWLPALGPALSCAAATAYHAAYYQDMGRSELARRLASIPPARLLQPAPPAAATWAPQTGTPWRPAAQNVTPPAYRPYGPPPGFGQPPAQQAPRTVPLQGPPETPTAMPSGESKPAPPSAGAFCGKCGARSQPGDRFCRACGALLEVPPDVTAA